MGRGWLSGWLNEPNDIVNPGISRVDAAVPHELRLSRTFAAPIMASAAMAKSGVGGTIKIVRSALSNPIWQRLQILAIQRPRCPGG